MKLIISITTAFLLALGMNGAHAATAVFEGKITQESYDAFDTSKSRVSVDYWQFSVAAPGDVTIDVLSWEKDPNNWSWRDVNQDGEESFIDSSIHVFKSGLGVDNLFASNDDGGKKGRDDGSIRGNDSFISTHFEAGDYIIAISSCGYAPYFSALEAVNGMNDKAIIPYASGEGAHGDYRITVSGNLAAVPVPGAFWLLGTGLLGFAGLNRKLRD